MNEKVKKLETVFPALGTHEPPYPAPKLSPPKKQENKRKKKKKKNNLTREPKTRKHTGGAEGGG